ncbi:MAG: MBL fold metallo-hydrolase [Clostridia bacterium]|nr:MBL fold metallo-hydrolase [Clostridia bacterium]
MKITRTANAGVLLEMNGKSLLLDGVCGEVYPYTATPKHLLKGLLSADALLYTHAHTDHFDGEFTEQFKNHGTVIGPVENTYNIGDIGITAVSTRHIGRSDIMHASFIIEGEKNVWFMGDASPSALSEMDGDPDVIIAPFAYANTRSAFRRTLMTGAKHIIILHLPEKEKDELSLYGAVLSATNGDVTVLEMEQSIIL